MTAAASTSSTKSSSGTLVPGINNAEQIPVGMLISIFVAGLEAYTSLQADTIQLRGREGDPIKFNVVGTRAGRLFQLARELMDQSASTYGRNQAGQSFGVTDVGFFNALAEAYGKDKIGPLEPYTVLIVQRDYDNG